MKQYLLSIYQPNEDPPPPEVLEPIMRELHAANEELKTAGAWVLGAGLHPPSTATVVRVNGRGVVTTDGPFIESKELLGGFTIIQVPDLDAALQWARRFADVTTLPIEVRPILSDVLV